MGRLMVFLKSRPRRSQRGDTIIEVLLSLTILSLALASAYSLSSASLRNSISANQRTEALVLAQSQIDLLTNAKDNNVNFATEYMTAAPYCINPDGSQNTTVGSDKLCPGYNNTVYNIGISFDGDSQIFTVSAQWSSPDAPQGIAKMNLYYKLPSVYKTALVSTGAVTNLTQNSGTFNGSVDPNGVALTACYFRYGPTTNYGSQVECSSIPGGTSGNSAVSANVGGLSPNSTYHFVLCATNKTVGASCDSDVAFNTALKPVTTTQAASPVGAASATLRGTVNPSGSALTDCYFDFGSTTGYGSRIGCASIPAGTSGDQPVSGSAASLNPNTGYHFRFCATNTAGTSCGGDQAFQTSFPAPLATMTSAYSYWQVDNGSLDLAGTVNTSGASGTTAWFEQSCSGAPDNCNFGAFPTSPQATNGGSVSVHIHPWTFYYFGFHTPWYFRLCAQNAFGSSCSSFYPMYWPSGF